MLAAADKAFSLCVVSWDICSGEVFDERFPPIIARLRDHCDYLLGGWFFFNAFLFLLDGRGHKVLDEHSSWNFSLG